MQHPLIVEAIEDLFLPLLVLNNRMGGNDEALLKYFGEPSWNFQVIRFLNGDGTDIIPRRDRVWTVGRLAGRMVMALEKLGRTVPRYLQGLVIESETDKLDEVVFGMTCFWQGEYKLGKIPGVVKTEAGWFDHREVTKVTYHEHLITLTELVGKAAEERCAERVYLRPGQQAGDMVLPVSELVPDAYKPASAGDQKKQLSLWPETQNIPYLSPMQQMWLNSWGPENRSRAIEVLSPRQRKALADAHSLVRQE